MSGERRPERPLRVALGSPNRHWTFDLGRELERLGVLHRLYTMYPKRMVDTVPRRYVRTFPWFAGASYGLGKLGWAGAWQALEPTRVRTYDQWLRRAIEPCDVFHCIASYGLHTHRRVRDEFGGVTVTDRGCAHIRVQDRIIQEERTTWGLEPNPINPGVVAREVTEYDECDLIVVPSPFARQTFIDEGVPAGKVRCVPFSADLSMFKPVPKEDDVFRVLYVGAISLEKGIPYLLQAFAAPADRECEVWLVGPETAETAFIFSKFPDGYRYFGPKPRAELSWYYSQASVLVLPSVQDGFGMVMAQAMACGVPVIATDHTGVHALFEDGEAGFHVPCREPEALRDAAFRLRRDPALHRELSARAMARLTELGGWRAYGEAIVDVYRSGVASRT